MSSITANTPSPHFKFPPSPCNDESNNDYFTFNNTTSTITTNTRKNSSQSPSSPLIIPSPKQSQPSSYRNHDFTNMSTTITASTNKNLYREQQQEKVKNVIYEDEDDPMDSITSSSTLETNQSSSSFNKNHSYFFDQPKIKPTLKKLHHKYDSISSVKSTSSELTLFDTQQQSQPQIHLQRPKFGSNESYNSTTTLFDSQQQQQQQKMPSSSSSISILSPTTRKASLSTSASASTMRFPFDFSSFPPSSSSSSSSPHHPDHDHQQPPPIMGSYSSASASPISATDTLFHQQRSSIHNSSPHATTPTRPPMAKHTMSLSQDISRFNPRPNRDMIYQLPESSSFITTEQLTNFIKLSKFDKVTGLSNLIIIDVRPFGEFCKNHIQNSINICLSSTLLKRSSFDLKRCIDSLPSCDKLLFSAHFQNHCHYDQNLNNGIPCSDSGFPSIVLYDSCTESELKSSSSISFTASKFTQDKDWNSPIFILKGGFKEFVSHNSNIFLSNQDNYINTLSIPETFPRTSSSLSSSSSSPSNFEFIRPVTASSSNLLLFASSNSSPSSIHSMNSSTFQPPPIKQIASASATARTGTPPSAPPSFASKLVTDSPILARFVLPAPTNTVFKTRHNDEVLTIARQDFGLSLKEAANLSLREQRLLPQWMVNTIGDDCGCTSIAQKFNTLETTERDRLQRVFSTASMKELDCPQISTGVELGNKNRYKDILPYEHSRVKLSRESKLKKAAAADDYINASYISSSISKNKYIATQGPLTGTIGDFWQLVVSHHSPIILSLTAQNEDGVEKCAPFWELGVYHDEFDQSIEVRLLEQDEQFMVNNNSKTPMILRRLQVVVDQLLCHEILQLQLVSWPDYGASVEKNDLLSLVSLKKNILTRLGCETAPVIVHCSAGCGRTGTFCAIDSAIDLLIKEDAFSSITQQQPFPKSNIIDGAGFSNQKNLNEKNYSNDNNDDNDVENSRNNNNNEKSNVYHNSEEKDPILEIVDGFRRQRISMVQTMRQYLLIYDTVLLFMKNKISIIKSPQQSQANQTTDDCFFVGKNYTNSSNESLSNTTNTTTTDNGGQSYTNEEGDLLILHAMNTSRSTSSDILVHFINDFSHYQSDTAECSSPLPTTLPRK